MFSIKRFQPPWRFARLRVCCIQVFGLLIAFAISDSNAESRLRFENVGESTSVQTLVSTDARHQLQVTKTNEQGLAIDVTRNVVYSAVPEGTVSIDATGLVKPIRDGTVDIVALDESGLKASTTLTISGTQTARSISFANQIMPIFTKLGCNGGGCHGKIAGQNGFRLSLLGFDPPADHKRLVAESRGRRVSLAAPDRSLLLMKTVNALPHGGGARTEVDSYEYRLLRRWLIEGMPYGTGNEPTVTSIRVIPDSRRMLAKSSQQIAVVATLSDGTTEDVTRAAVFESNDDQMADVSATGLVTIAETVGDVSVMARYQGHVSVFRAEVPLRVEPESRIAGEDSHIDNVVDRHVLKKLRSLGIEQSASSDDSTYLRRVTLDIAGRIPTLEETSEFLSDTSPDKRAKLVDRLLNSDDYASFFARKWSVILRNKRNGGPLQLTNIRFHHWVKESIRTNKPYDQFAEELLTASGSISNNPAAAWFQYVSDRNERVEDISQLFLGQRIQCARCHHHPYEKWSQQDYAGMLAFFANVSRKTPTGDVTFVSRVASASAPNPRTGQAVKPTGLDAAEAKISDTSDPRLALAEWITSKENQFFAKSLVNRYWKHFMGRGLVEPEDDMRVTNPPSNPELMDALAQSFIDSDFDLRELIRTICLSNTYSAASDANDHNVIDRRSYSRFYPKRLQAETLLDAIDVLTDTKTVFAGMPVSVRATQLPDTGFDSYFLTVFGQPKASTACECERSSEANLAQSLHLLNSEQINKKLTADDGRAAKLAADTETPVDEKLGELYQTAFSRLPDESELASSKEYLAGKENQRQAWEDLIWALMNSKEFLFNH